MAVTITRPKYKKNFINFTPLVDMVFMLLLFFMLTTKFGIQQMMEVGFSDTKASASAGGLSSILMVLVRSDHRLELNGTVMEPEQFSLSLKRIMNDHPERAVLLKSESSVSVQDMVSAMDLVRASGVSSITLME